MVGLARPSAIFSEMSRPVALLRGAVCQRLRGNPGMRENALGEHLGALLLAHVAHPELPLALLPPLAPHLLALPRRPPVLLRLAFVALASLVLGPAIDRTRRALALCTTRNRIRLLVLRLVVAAIARNRRAQAPSRTRRRRRRRAAADDMHAAALLPRAHREHAQVLLLGLLLLLRNLLLHQRALANFFARVAVGDVERLGELRKAVVDVDLCVRRQSHKSVLSPLKARHTEQT